MKKLLLLAWTLLAAGTLQPAQAAQFWLTAEDPTLTRAKHLDIMSDYMDLFTPAAPWQRAAGRLSVFKIAAQTVLYGSDDMLRTIVNDMHRRHVAVAIEMGAVLRTDECGGGEGYAPPDLVDRVAGKLRRLGLVLDEWAMDEPVWLPHLLQTGHGLQGRPVCAYPIPEIARRVAVNVARMRQYFPNIRVGTIDVVSAQNVPGPTLVRDNMAFADAFARQTGRPLAFWHADVAWRSGDWQTPLGELVRQLRQRGVRYGVIIGGTPAQQTSRDWVSVALEHLRTLADNPAWRPDDVVVQSWQELPTRMLPESDPGTVTFELLEAERIAG